MSKVWNLLFFFPRWLFCVVFILIIAYYYVIYNISPFSSPVNNILFRRKAIRLYNSVLPKLVQILLSCPPVPENGTFLFHLSSLSATHPSCSPPQSAVWVIYDAAAPSTNSPAHFESPRFRPGLSHWHARARLGRNIISQSLKTPCVKSSCHCDLLFSFRGWNPI